MLNFLKQEMNRDLKLRVFNHKERFMRLFYSRYMELLPFLIHYKNAESVSINFLQMETALRHGYDVVIGENKLGNIVMLGFLKSREDFENPSIFQNRTMVKKDDIEFIIPKHYIPSELNEITTIDDCKSGNFIVVKNKTLNLVNDREIVIHYTSELAELVISRYSLAMQSKIHTFFMSEINDETINHIINDLYNGIPYVKTSALFDPKDNIHTLENGNLAQNFAELKREYQNKISELNNMLGINSLAVEKESGVSDEEAKSNRGYTTSNANIYLDSRNNAFKRLNKRYNLNIEAIYNDEVESQLMEFEKERELSDENDHNPNGYDTIGNDKERVQ